MVRTCACDELSRAAQEKNISAGCSKRPLSKAAASEEARRTLRYVEPLIDARTPLADFFSILVDEAQAKGSTVVSMKDDWKTIFPPETK